MQRLRYPFVVIGAASVGKTSIALRYCKNVFQEVISPTMCSDLYSKVIIDNDRGIEVELQIHDIGGQEQYKIDKVMYLKQAYAVIIVFSVVDIASFDALESLVNEVRDNGQNDPIIMIVANKIDLRDGNPDAITTDQVENEAHYLNVNAFIEASAKMGTNIQEIFSMLIDECYDRESFKIPAFSEY